MSASVSLLLKGKKQLDMHAPGNSIIIMSESGI